MSSDLVFGGVVFLARVLEIDFLLFLSHDIFPYGSIQTISLVSITFVFGIADLTRLQLRKCNNHLVSFIKVDGLSVSYIVIVFVIIKSRMMVYRSMECPHF